MPTATNVTSGKPSTSGAIFTAVTGTALPTDTTTALAEAFESLGYISEDGLTNSNSPSSETVNAWGGDTVLVVNTTKEDTFTFTLIEALSDKALGVVFGTSNVDGTLSEGITVKSNSLDLPEASYVFDMILRNGVKKRIVVPRAKVTEVGDVTYTDSDAVGYEVTIQALPDADGNTHYEYIK